VSASVTATTKRDARERRPLRSAVMPALANAVYDAVGVRIDELPITPEKVLRATTNPMLLVRADHEGVTEQTASLTSVIVPLDGSELAETVLPSVIRIAKKLSLEVFLIRVYSNPYSGFISGGGHYAVNVDKLMEDIRDQARKYLEAKMTELGKRGVEQVSYLLQEGNAADEIVSIAEQTPESLIAMCSHGRSGVKRWVLGSVAETVRRHANNPVLVVRPTIAAE
jgi:nucleotide-binding universal stress UspA family protein